MNNLLKMQWAINESLDGSLQWLALANDVKKYGNGASEELSLANREFRNAVRFIGKMRAKKGSKKPNNNRMEVAFITAIWNAKD
jgi:hypothetical protein